jgi:hypothetical protein
MSALPSFQSRSGVCRRPNSVELTRANQRVYFSVLNVAHDTQIFYTVVCMYTIFVVNLLTLFQGFDERIRNKSVDQKRLATLRAQAAIAKPNFNIRFGSPGIFLCSERHDFFRHWNLAPRLAPAHTRKRLHTPKRADLVLTFVVANVGPHFNISIVALMLLHGYPFQTFLR